MEQKNNQLSFSKNFLENVDFLANLVKNHPDFQEGGVFLELAEHIGSKLEDEKSKKKALENFANFFENKTEGLFFQFGLDAINLYNKINRKEKNKYVRVMPEHLANPIWQESGVMMSWDYLELENDDLMRQLIEWNYEWQKLSTDLMYDEIEHRKLSQEEKDQINKDLVRLKSRGEILCSYLLDEKPDWKIIYQFDSEQKEIKESKPMWIMVNNNELKIEEPAKEWLWCEDNFKSLKEKYTEDGIVAVRLPEGVIVGEKTEEEFEKSMKKLSGKDSENLYVVNLSVFKT